MRRLMLLTLLTLVLPTAALANGFKLQIGPPLTVDNFTGNSRACLSNLNISCSTGNYFNGHNINVGGDNWVLNLVGPSGRIELDIIRLTVPLTGANCALNGPAAVGTCNFSGMVTAFGPGVPGGTFTDSISGTLTKGPSPVVPVGADPWLLATLTGTLATNPEVAPGSNLSVTDVQFCRSEQSSVGCGTPGTLGRLRSGHGAATLSVKGTTIIPEPSTLELLGTGLLGLLGLPGLARRKLKLGT